MYISTPRSLKSSPTLLSEIVKNLALALSAILELALAMSRLLKCSSLEIILLSARFLDKAINLSDYIFSTIELKERFIFANFKSLIKRCKYLSVLVL